MQINVEEKMLNGIIPVYKKKGFTSFDVVAKLRGIFKTKRIGHTGTLDPDAEGVLPVCLGKATKLVEMLTDNPKTYEAKMLLGIITDTQDISGKILKKSDFEGSTEDIINTANTFKGNYDQIPPMYSALKVGGKKLCDIAREGKTVERKPRRVFVYDIDVSEVRLIKDKPSASIRVRCSKGTYIRTLINDIGEKLGCGACMEKLLRTEAAGYSLGECLTLQEIEERVKAEGVESVIRPVEDVFKDFPKLKVTKESEPYLNNGNKLYVHNFSDFIECMGCVRVYNSDGAFKAIYVREDDHFKVKYMLF